MLRGPQWSHIRGLALLDWPLAVSPATVCQLALVRRFFTLPYLCIVRWNGRLQGSSGPMVDLRRW